MAEANRPWVNVSKEVGAVAALLFPKSEKGISLEIHVHGGQIEQFEFCNISEKAYMLIAKKCLTVNPASPAIDYTIFLCKFVLYYSSLFKNIELLFGTNVK